MDSQGMGGDPAPLSIYRLIPTATRSDRRFARDAYHGEIVVRAYSPSDARRVASEAEAASPEGPPPEGSPFHDVALYSVIEVVGAGACGPGNRGADRDPPASASAAASIGWVSRPDGLFSQRHDR